MNHLIVQARNGRPCIRVVDEAEVITGPFESWILDTGKRILAVDTVLPRKLRHLHIGGGFYQAGSFYGTTYEELVLMVKELLGLTDRERYELALEEQGRVGMDIRRTRWANISNGSLAIIGFGLRVFGMVVKTVVTLAIVPVVIAWLNNRSKNN